VAEIWDDGNSPIDDPSTYWQVAHDHLGRLARARAGLDEEEGRWLLAAWRQRVHARLGYGSFSEYVGRLFGYGARLVQEELRVAEALEGLPAMARALQSGSSRRRQDRARGREDGRGAGPRQPSR
jgi:hypothetical protein